jgi:hypothetical protein
MIAFALPLFPFPGPFPTLLAVMAQKGGCGQKGGSREERPMVFRDAAASFRYGVKKKRKRSMTVALFRRQPGEHRLPPRSVTNKGSAK